MERQEGAHCVTEYARSAKKHGFKRGRNRTLQTVLRVVPQAQVGELLLVVLLLLLPLWGLPLVLPLPL